MSPEQCRGAGTVDAKTDVYSLGVLLYQMLAGRPPFVAEGSGELLGMHLFRAPPPLQELAPAVPVALAALVHRLLEKDRDARPVMREVAAEIEMIQARPALFTPMTGLSAPHQTSHAEQPTVVPHKHSTLGRSVGQREKSSLRRRTRLVVAMGFGIGVVLAGIWAVLFLVEHKRLAAAGPGTVVPPLVRHVPDMKRPQGGVEPVLSPKFVEQPNDSLSKPTQPATSADEIASARRPAFVRWSIVTRPPGATVVSMESGVILGRTPWSVERPKTEGTFKVRLESLGFEDKIVPFDGTRSTQRIEQLTRTRSRATIPASPSDATRSRPTVAAPKSREEKPNAEPARPPFTIID